MDQDKEINELKNRVGILEVKYDGIKESLDEIRGGIKTINWLIIGGFVTAILGFILKGGVIQ